MEVGREGARLVEPARGDLAKARGVDDPGVDLALPEHGEARALSVFVEAREMNDGVFVLRVHRGLVDKVEPRADPDEVALLGKC